MTAIPQTADLVVEARWVIPVEPPGAVLTDHAVVVDGGRIVAVAPSADAAARFAARQRVQLLEHALIPGLVNLHTHAAMTLMRGLADDIALMEWLKGHIWPVETRLASPEFVHDGTLLACAEMLRGGVTCFNDMYFFPEATARAALEAGMRAVPGMIVVEFPSPYAADAADYLRRGLATRDEFRDEGLVSFCFAPHAPYTVSDRAFEQIATLVGELDVPVHIHLHETRDEIAQSLQQHGMRPLERLQRLGLVGSNLLAVHGVYLEAAEIAELARCGCHVAHCPSSNLKLASGLAPVVPLVNAGVNVGLGTDGAASNNRLDMFTEMRLAALLAKGTSGEPTALPARQALQMATLNSARALGLEAVAGSLVPGKRADLVAVNLGALELSPCYDPVSHLVYAAGREHVTHVWVDGRPVVQDGAVLTVDHDALAAKAAHWQDRIRQL